MRKILKTVGISIIYSILVAGLLSQLNTMAAFADALPQNELQALDNYPNWVAESGQCSSSSGGANEIAITGNNVKDTYSFFVANGYTPAGAAGLTGNFMWESDGSGGNIIPNGNPSGGGSYGIAQWLGGRLTNMRAFVAAEGKDPSTLGGQLDFVLHELNTSYPTVAQHVKPDTDPVDAADYVMTYYESPNPSEAHQADRENWAKTVYNQYSGTSVSAGTSGAVTGCIAAGSTSPDCVSASGDAKILCAAKAYNGIYYQYGGGPHSDGAFSKFEEACPSSTLTGAAINSTADNPGPCATDCSGLVSVAVDSAFGQNLGWNVESLEDDTANWQPVSKGDIQPGDVVVEGTEHVEIVDHYDSSGGGTLYTFGSHHTGTTTGEVTSTLSTWTAAYHYVGAGS